MAHIEVRINLIWRLLFFETKSGSIAQLVSNYVARAGMELKILLPLPLECKYATISSLTEFRKRGSKGVRGDASKYSHLIFDKPLGHVSLGCLK
jgi:hypothetical protein